MNQAERWELTANQYLALPMISGASGAIHNLNVLLRAAFGLVEWSGDDRAGRALLTPELLVDGKPVVLENLVWERLDRWVPRFKLGIKDGLTLTATLCAPTGYDAARRGAFYQFELENRSSTDHRVSVALVGEWAASFQIVGTRRPLAAQRRIALPATRPGVVLELAGAAAAALGVVVFGSDAEHRVEAAALGQELLEPGQQRVLSFGEVARFRVSRSLSIAAGKRGTVTFYMGVAAERDGALATAAAQRRLGADNLLKETRLELARLARKTRDAALGAVLNRNLAFAYFFGVARGLDDDRLYPLTSRSPEHPRCGTFTEREALLWSMPALQLADPPLARELLFRCFEQYSHRPGEAVRYLDGGVLDPGFALDNWCGYVLAAAGYVEATGDTGFVEEPLIAEVVRELETGIYTRLHPEVFLAQTELLPSGDPADHPYVTYDNALLHAVFRAIARLRGEESEEGKRAIAAADEITAAIWRRALADVAGLPVLAWSMDLAESASIYDDPAGSLQMLPHYRFCDRNEPIWRNTMEFVRSERYPLWLGKRKFPGLASRSQPNIASMAALCADLLSDRRDAAFDVLRQLVLSGGVAATHYDPDTGAAAGALHDAALAGFVAWSLHLALNQ